MGQMGEPDFVEPQPRAARASNRDEAKESLVDRSMLAHKGTRTANDPSLMGRLAAGPGCGITAQREPGALSTALPKEEI